MIIFYHPENKATKDSKRLFDHSREIVYSDFIRKMHCSEKQFLMGFVEGF